MEITFNPSALYNRSISFLARSCKKVLRMQDFSSYSVLLVDDEGDIIEYLAEEFGGIGFNTSCANGVKTALKMISERAFDVIISD